MQEKAIELYGFRECGQNKGSPFQEREGASWPVRHVIDISDSNYRQCPEERIKLSIKEGCKMYILSFNKNNCGFPPKFKQIKWLSCFFLFAVKLSQLGVKLGDVFSCDVVECILCIHSSFVFLGEHFQYRVLGKF